MQDMFPKALDISYDISNKGNFVPNVEAMLNLKPDIVFQWGNKGMGIVDPIKNAGMKVALVKYGNQQALETMLNCFGAVTAKNEKVRTIIDWHRNTLAKMKEKNVRPSPRMKNREFYFLSGLFPH